MTKKTTKASITNNARLQLMAVLGDGGHTAEMIQLLELLGPQYNYTYLVSSSDHISTGKITIPGPIHYITRPRDKGEGTFKVLWKLLLCFLQTAWLLYKVRPDAILGSGPALMVPPALLGKLAGIRVIYIENACRTTEISLTGRIMIRIADLFFVQWEYLQERYPQTIFAGRLL